MTHSGIPCVLLCCGSFNPPTILHLRMFEIARDYLNENTDFEVIGGVLSPVHDSYGKKDLCASDHRIEMAKLATSSSDWIGIDKWECAQSSWSRTVQVLRHLSRLLEVYLHRKEKISFKQYLSIYDLGHVQCENPVADESRVMLLCGADLLESFSVKDLWSTDDMTEILSTFGMVVITRSGSDPFRYVYENDLVYRYQKNVHIVTEWIPNEISSTAIRRALRRKASVRYLVSDAVLEYIEANKLYTNS
ncbi:CTP transf 2 domain containing protein [Trichuris trichiura]|uniref:Nicotinamide-nucleotide adenylyltransferase n=1 Tax=Trichuris trichiura TaxID=36087 RepID=A0A077ZK36_TRITR|nr:CTP transf 2 domain containing protein [Trichuris trichiura]